MSVSKLPPVDSQNLRCIAQLTVFIQDVTEALALEDPSPSKSIKTYCADAAPPAACGIVLVHANAAYLSVSQGIKNKLNELLPGRNALKQLNAIQKYAGGILNSEQGGLELQLLVSGDLHDTVNRFAIYINKRK
jgi:hypothetical protein